MIAGWLVLGMPYSASVTPSSRLLRRFANAEDWSALFAAQFALSHVCGLICYPLACQLGVRFGMASAFGSLPAIAAAGTVAAILLWPADDPDVVADDPHHLEHAPGDHPFVIDRRHKQWPKT